MILRKRFPDLEFEMGGVAGSVDVIGDGSRGDLAALRISRIVSHERRRRASLVFRMSARTDTGMVVPLEAAEEHPPLEVRALSTGSAGRVFFLPVGFWDSEPFEIEVEDTVSGKRFDLPYVGRIRSRG